jgi:hypothetical protein
MPRVMEKKKNTPSAGVNAGDKKFVTQESRSALTVIVGKTTRKAPKEIPIKIWAVEYDVR